MEISLGVPVTGGRDALETGYGLIPREQVNMSGVMVSGTVRFTYFNALTNITVVSIRTFAGGTGATGGTLARVGLYLVAANGDLNQVGASANDATMWATANTAYTKALSVATPLTAGVRYAMAVIWTGTTPGHLAAQGTNTLNFGTEAAEAPRIWAIRTGQTDLNASYTAAQLQNTGQYRVYGVLIP